MCEQCWKEAGQPIDLPETFDRFAELVEDLYNFAPGGGPLHAELDNWNLDHQLIRPFPGMDFEDEYDQTDNTVYVYQIADEIADLLSAMPVPQRYAANAKIDGLF